MSDADVAAAYDYYAQPPGERQREYDDESEARFRTDEMEPGESASLAEMIWANPTEEYGFDNDDLHEWLRTAKVGDQFRDIVTVERVA